MSSAGFLLDTNVISEMRRKRPDSNVLRFVRSTSVSRLFVSVLTIGELRKGAEMRRRSSVAESVQLHKWIDEVELSFADRVLPVDLLSARMWGQLAAERPRPTVDTLLAATAIVFDLTLATRNLRDVGDTGAVLLNPWQQPQ